MNILKGEKGIRLNWREMVWLKSKIYAWIRIWTFPLDGGYLCLALSERKVESFSNDHLPTNKSTSSSHNRLLIDSCSTNINEIYVLSCFLKIECNEHPWVISGWNLHLHKLCNIVLVRPFLLDQFPGAKYETDMV